jgi:hypothetical protein
MGGGPAATMAGCRIVSGDVKVGMKGWKMRTLGLAAWLTLTACSSAGGEISRIWLTHRTTDPGRIVMNWETAEPGNSVVHYGLSRDSMETVEIKSLDGRVLDRKEFEAKDPSGGTGNPQPVEAN